MNLRALCFFRLAAAAGNGALWWDYALRFADQCTTANNTFNSECATRVRGPSRAGSCRLKGLTNTRSSVKGNTCNLWALSGRHNV